MPVAIPLDPELAAALAAMPMGLSATLDFDDMPGSRERMAARRPLVLPGDDIDWEDRKVPGPEGSPEITLRIYRPKTQTAPLPVFYWIHGGGMVLGTLDGDNERLSGFVREVGCVAVSVDYRLAPENPHPAPVEDCYAGIAWTVANAEELRIDASRVAIGGASAGGGLAAATALLCRDRGGPTVGFQLLVYPMIDDRNTHPSTHEPDTAGIWSRRTNLGGWKALLGDAAGGENVSEYAAPSRATDVSRLPAAFIDVGTADLFRDEEIDYAQRLKQAGVPTELHVYAGAYHGFEGIAPNARLTLAAKALRYDALRRAFGG
jgi:acetyl esterase/lipase